MKRQRLTLFGDNQPREDGRRNNEDDNMSVSETVYFQILDRTLELLKTAAINGHTWTALKAMKTYFRANTISVAVTTAAEEIIKQAPASYGKPATFTKVDHKRVRAAIERRLKDETAEDKAIRAEEREERLRAAACQNRTAKRNGPSR
jgi:hypothetical protein